MPAKSLEAQVRHQPRVAIVDLESGDHVCPPLLSTSLPSWH